MKAANSRITVVDHTTRRGQRRDPQLTAHDSAELDVLQQAGSVVVDKLLTVDGLAIYLGVKKSWVYAHVRELPAVRLGNLLRFRRGDVDRWLDEQTELHI